jgi:glyoxylase-like metal-dependent hydrolase (beta-lactamase superfamily II)
MAPEDPPDTPDPPAEAPSVSAADLARRLAAGDPVHVLDVRDRDEVEAWRIDGPSVTHTHIPVSRFLQAQVTDGVADLAAEFDDGRPITAVCPEGAASEYVAGLLADAGVDVHNLDGGMAAWARVYPSTRLQADPVVVQYHRPATGCLGYLVRSGGEAVVVDPLRAFVETYLADAAEADATIVAVVDTHLHADHLSGLRALADAADARRVVPRGTAERGLSFQAETVGHGDDIAVGGAALRARHLPGHTTDMTGFAVGDALLTGDSLFLDGVARPDLQVDEGADPAVLARTLHETLTDGLADFSEATLVAPGHAGASVSPTASGGYTATLGTLRERLAVFDQSAEAFASRLVDDLPPPPANADRIVGINRGRESLETDAALDLELGPNRCGVAGLAED